MGRRRTSPQLSSTRDLSGLALKPAQDLAEGRKDAEREAFRFLVRLQEDGLAVPSGVRIRGKFALRVANVNHRSRREDFQSLVDNSVRLGRESQV